MVYIVKFTNKSGVTIEYEFSNKEDRRKFTIKAVEADRMATISKIEFIESEKINENN